MEIFVQDNQHGDMEARSRGEGETFSVSPCLRVNCPSLRSRAGL
jgi:hypothetical protein